MKRHDTGYSNELHLPSKKAEKEIINVFLTVIICSLMLLNTDKRVQREDPDDNAYSTMLKAIKAVLFCSGLKNVLAHVSA